MPPTGTPTRKKEEISEKEHHKQDENGNQRTNKKKRIPEDGAADEQGTKISKKVKHGDDDVGIQVTFWDAAFDFSSVHSAYVSQSVEKRVHDPVTGKYLRTIKVPCVVTKKFVANRAFRVGTAFVGDVLNRVVKKSIQSTLGLDFAFAMPLPVVSQVINIVAEDLPGLFGLIASETSSEVVMLFADLAVSDDKRRYFATMTGVSEHATCTSPYKDQIRCGISMQINENLLVNLLPTGTQLIAVIIGNIVKNFTKMILKRIFFMFGENEKYIRIIKEILDDLTQVFYGFKKMDWFATKWKEKITESFHTSLLKICTEAVKISEMVGGGVASAIDRLAVLAVQAKQKAEQSTEAFMKKNQIKINAEDFIVDEAFEEWSRENYTKIHDREITLLNNNEEIEKQKEIGKGYLTEIAGLYTFFEKKIDDKVFKNFFRAMAFNIFGKEDALNWEKPSQKFIRKSTLFDVNPLSVRYIRNPHYVQPTQLQHNH